MASKAVAKAASTVGGKMPIASKQTLQSTGIWERIRRAVVLDPDRSNGVPLNPHFRRPPPGSNDPLQYDDPVTLPAGDIADNPYWKRDARRAYPRLSYVNQSHAVGLLSVGSAAAPKQELVGEAGQKALVAARQEGDAPGGLAAFVEAKGAAAVAKDLLVDGLPPLPSGQRLQPEGNWKVHDYSLVGQEEAGSYPDKYPCRSFK